MSIYQNIFHYYRGQTKNKDEGSSILQIENNVTKALLNLLQHSSRRLTENFLEFVGIPFCKDNTYEYRYQVNGSLDKITKVAMVLGISESNEIKRGEIKTYNIPDGAIVSEDVSLLIENKIGYNSYLMKEQLEGHKRNFAPGQVVVEEPLIIVWSDIRKFFLLQQESFEKPEDNLTLFLLNQFEEFCTINGLGDKQKSKEYFFLRFEKEKARNLAKAVDCYISDNTSFEVEDAGTKDGIGYKKIGTIKFATLTTARQRCLILHVGNMDQKLGLQVQEEIDEELGIRFNRKDYEYIKNPHEAYIRLEWVKDLNQISRFIDFAYMSR
jgi:hypothetical protein